MHIFRFVLTFIGTVSFCTNLLVLDAWRRMHSTYDADQTYEVAVVFTGQYDRTQKGVDLLKQGRVKTLVVSGVNAGAGLSVEGFAAQFGLSQTQWSAAVGKTLLLGTEADYTIENAPEVRRLLGDRKISQMLLITSQSHMPRASVLLKAEFPGADIVRLTTPDSTPGFALYEREFVKYCASIPYGAYQWLRRWVPVLPSVG